MTDHGASEREPSGFRCVRCGAWHEDVPLAFHATAPAPWSPELAGRAGCVLTGETCVIGDQAFFVRGLIRVPIVDHDEHFEWGVWVSLSEASFERMLAAWERPGREDLPAVFGWLSTELPVYEEPTLNLRTMVHAQPVGLRPHVELEPTGHPLAVEQRSGITRESLTERARLLLR